MQKKCLNCGILFDVKPSRYNRTQFHNKECMLAYKATHPMTEEVRNKISKSKTLKLEKRICLGCGVEFEVKERSKRKYHSRECAMRTIGKRSHNNIWNKGLPKDDPRVQAKAQKQAQTMKEKYATGEITVWNKGLTSETDERMAKLTEHLTDLRNTEGEWKNNWKKSITKGQVEAWANGVYDHAFAFTKPEQLTWAYLESLGYPVKEYKNRTETDSPNTWYHQYPFMDALVPDFACPDLKAIIEVNGCAVHGHDLTKCKNEKSKYGWYKAAEQNLERDKRKYSMYYRNDWKWAIVWECEAENGDFHRIKKYLL